MKKIALVAATLLSLVAQPALSEDINEVFKKVNELVQQKNYPRAMEELSWAQKELEKLHQARLAQLLPSDVEGFKGGETEFQSVMGFTNIEREYQAGEKSIRLAITGTSGADGMGGLAGIAKMGMMMGGVQSGTDQFRLAGRTAQLDSSSGSPELSVFLESGSILKLSAGDGIEGATLKKFAEALKIAELDSYLKGASN
jgi:hypothetical protein